MVIDVLINSCARPDVLEISINTFLKKIKTDKHKFRYVLLEDVVTDKCRQEESHRWIKNNNRAQEK